MSVARPLIASHLLSIPDSGKITKAPRADFVGHVLEHPLPRAERGTLAFPLLKHALELVVAEEKQSRVGRQIRRGRRRKWHSAKSRMIERRSALIPQQRRHIHRPRLRPRDALALVRRETDRDGTTPQVLAIIGLNVRPIANLLDAISLLLHEPDIRIERPQRSLVLLDEHQHQSLVTRTMRGPILRVHARGPRC